MSLGVDIFNVVTSSVAPRLVQFMKGKMVETTVDEVSAIIFGMTEEEYVVMKNTSLGTTKPVSEVVPVEEVKVKVEEEKPAKKKVQSKIQKKTVEPVDAAKQVEEVKEVVQEDKIEEKVEEKVSVEEEKVKVPEKKCEYEFSRKTKQNKRGEKCGKNVVAGSSFCKAHIKTGVESTNAKVDLNADTPPIVPGMCVDANDDEDKPAVITKSIHDCGFTWDIGSYSDYVVEEKNQFLVRQLPDGRYTADFVVVDGGAPRPLTAAEKEIAKASSFIVRADDDLPAPTPVITKETVKEVVAKKEVVKEGKTKKEKEEVKEEVITKEEVKTTKKEEVVNEVVKEEVVVKKEAEKDDVLLKQVIALFENSNPAFKSLSYEEKVRLAQMNVDKLKAQTKA